MLPATAVPTASLMCVGCVSTGKVEYFYAEVQTWHTTYPDDIEVFHFPNGQTEAHHPSGLKEVVFPDGAIRHAFMDGQELAVDAVRISDAIQRPCPQIDDIC